MHADVLKVGHHGSAYSSSPAFVAAVHPHYAIISVGRHNLYGHPAPSTIETLEETGARVYRTDENGAVTISTDGLNANVEPLWGFGGNGLANLAHVRFPQLSALFKATGLFCES